MILSGTPGEILSILHSRAPEIDGVLSRARESVREGKMKRAIYPYQAAALYVLAHAYDRPGARILEIGTYYGYSAAVLGQAAPQASVITLNPTPWEAAAARRNLAAFGNVSISEHTSSEYLATLAADLSFDMVFVDGDHKAVRDDFRYWDRLNEGGLILFHDYSPNGSARPCPPVYRALGEFIEWLGRPADVLVIDKNGVGMIGIIKQAGDPAWEE